MNVEDLTKQLHVMAVSLQEIIDAFTAPARRSRRPGAGARAVKGAVATATPASAPRPRSRRAA